MSTGRIARHRNYGELMARHERGMRIKRIARLITFFLLIIFLLVVFAIVVRWEKQEDKRMQQEKTSTIELSGFPTTLPESSS